jgi:hypothetical protein
MQVDQVANRWFSAVRQNVEGAGLDDIWSWRDLVVPASCEWSATHASEVQRRQVQLSENEMDEKMRKEE